MSLHWTPLTVDVEGAQRVYLASLTVHDAIGAYIFHITDLIHVWETDVVTTTEITAKRHKVMPRLDIPHDGLLVVLRTKLASGDNDKTTVEFRHSSDWHEVKLTLLSTLDFFPFKWTFRCYRHARSSEFLKQSFILPLLGVQCEYERRCSALLQDCQIAEYKKKGAQIQKAFQYPLFEAAKFDSDLREGAVQQHTVSGYLAKWGAMGDSSQTLYNEALTRITSVYEDGNASSLLSESAPLLLPQTVSPNTTVTSPTQSHSRELPQNNTPLTPASTTPAANKRRFEYLGEESAEEIAKRTEIEEKLRRAQQREQAKKRQRKGFV